MNEVGGNPQCRGFSTELLHRENAARLREHPHSVLASSTHDTKRGEDARHRLAALTELPAGWAACVRRWRRLKGRMRVGPPLGAAQEYLLLQALLAIWPSTPPDAAGRESLRERLQAYAVKSAREAKQHTSWLDPDEGYEQSMCDFVARMVAENAGAGFERYFQPVLDEVALRGMLGGLSAVVLKLTAPGVPDIYQGNELPALVLVDPDNRRTPDFARHAAVLDEIRRASGQPDRTAFVTQLREQWRDGRLKLFVTWRLLALRREHPALFDAGDYVPLEALGEHAPRLCAYARADASESLIVVVSRWTAGMGGDGEARWADSRIAIAAPLPPGSYVDLFTGHAVEVPEMREQAPRELAVAPLLSVLPVCALLRVG
jgi:(1->4)-alpha-D-glucan 1-alpha-D-glucosylmutase